MKKPEDSKKEKPVIKSVSFKKKERPMLKFLAGLDFSYYVKSLIRKDMEKQEELKEKREHLKKLLREDSENEETQDLKNEDSSDEDM